MKKATILSLAALLSVAVASSAMAGGQVWWETPGAVSQGPGQPLVLTCDTSAGPTRCEWLITVMYSSDGGGASWALSMRTDDLSMDKVQMKQGPDSPLIFDSALSSPTNHSYGSGPNPAPGILIEDIGSGTFSPAPPATYQLFQFRLSKNKFQGDTNDAFIFAAIGGSEFGGNDTPGGYEVVQIGPNAPREGNNVFDYEPLPVIVIDNVPEPTTIALLGLGLVGLLRRRR